jgi:hypothetical protein
MDVWSTKTNHLTISLILMAANLRGTGIKSHPQEKRARFSTLLNFGNYFKAGAGGKMKKELWGGER